MFNLLNTLVNALQDILGELFFSSSPEFKRKKELRRLNGELRKMTPQLYRADKTLLPSFATLLYQLYHFLQPIKIIIERTIAAPDVRAAEKYQDMFFEALLPEEQAQQRHSFLFAERSNALASCRKYEDAEQIIQDQIHQFKHFLNIFNEPSFKTREQDYLNLFFLFDLCNFDYPAFLNHFNKNLSLNQTSDTPTAPVQFDEVFAVEVVQNLLDFQFIIKHVVIDEVTIEHITFLAKNIPDYPPDAVEKIEKTLRTIENILAVHLKRTTIPMILKLIKEDPDFEEDAIISETKPLNEYVQRLHDMFHADSNRLLKLQKEHTITALIESCFGTAELKSLEGYNDTINDGLQNFSTIAFDWIKPMQLLKAFTEQYFEARYKTFLQAILVEGFFANKQAELRYSTIVRACEVMPAKIKAFEQIFKPDGPCSIREIQQYIAEIEQGKDLKKQLHKIVDIANMQAKNLVQMGSKAYMDLYTCLGNMVEDTRKATPSEFITNIRAVAASAKNRDAFAAIEKDLQNHATFLEIMKNYAVLGLIEQSHTGQTVPPPPPKKKP